MSSSGSMAFVDDTDPHIRYSEGWTLRTVTTANATPAEFPVYPLYGTFHNSSPVGSANLSYTFNGTDITARFAPNTPIDAIKECLIDGQQQDAFLQESETAVVCTANKTLRDGTHELFIQVVPDSPFIPLLFDGLEYTPSGGDPSARDTIYTQQDIILAGKPFDFDFFGYSLGLYGIFSDIGPQSPSLASYAIDGQTAVNFTITRVITLTNGVLGQIVVQTPRLALGNHRFHLDFFGTNDSLPLITSRIIVQNSTFQVDLEPIPPISSSTASSSMLQTQTGTPRPLTSQNHKVTHLGIIVGATVAAVILTLLVVFGVLFHRRSRPISLDPFTRPRVHQNEHVKGTTERQTRPFESEHVKRRTEQVQAEMTDGIASGRGFGSNNFVHIRRPPRVVIHMDSGGAVNQSDTQSEVVELPPTYNSVAPPIPPSHPPSPSLPAPVTAAPDDED